MFANGLRSILSVLFMLGFCAPASALPWDRDMFSQQSLKSNEISRSPVKGTFPIGRKPFLMTTEEASEKLANPVQFDKMSVWHGQRIWNANCLPCHGVNAKSEGTIGQKMAAPNLLTDFYKQRTDGRFFGVLTYGGVNMPRYGYKFSEQEKWDVINYLRFLQGRPLEGISLPE